MAQHPALTEGRVAVITGAASGQRCACHGERRRLTGHSTWARLSRWREADSNLRSPVGGAGGFRG